MAVHQRSPSNLMELERICKEEWQRIPKSRRLYNEAPHANITVCDECLHVKKPISTIGCDCAPSDLSDTMLPYVFPLWCVMSVSSLHGVLSEEQLIQTTSEVRKPGESVKMSCKTSGFTFTAVFMHWIQQEPGKGLKWIGRIDPEDGETIYSETYKERFTMTTDNSITTAYLQIDRLTLEDSATYYCAIDTVTKPGRLTYKKTYRCNVIL
ncbi:unnamed protein product [Ranitomeya imitator]|uniref:Ig-like domain-containing protein n=1 Tax=Ranitomeya imitator TaxID=111125 RepID=A0ABN9LI38_9NEOB|nr:unnamed protein product [Ranitomeya imitator]